MNKSELFARKCCITGKGINDREEMLILPYLGFYRKHFLKLLNTPSYEKH